MAIISQDLLRRGDLLFFRGDSNVPLNAIVQIIAGSEFDHVAIVDDPSGEGGAVMIRHVMMGRGACLDPLHKAEKRPPLSILVRRHRHVGAGEAIADRAAVLHENTAGYAHHRNLFLTMLALTRWTSRLGEHPELERKVVEKVVLSLRGAHVTAVAEREAERRPEPGATRYWICPEFVAEACNVWTAADTHDGHDQYHGLVIVPQPLDGLLAWVASGDELAALAGVARPAPPSCILSMSETEVVHRFEAFDRTGSGRIAVSDAALRQMVVDVAVEAMSFTRSIPRHLAKHDLSDPVRVARWLLDRVLSEAPVISQEDLARSPSLVDLGELDPSLFARC